MLIIMNQGGTREEIERVLRLIEDLGVQGRPIPLHDRMGIGISGCENPLDPSLFAGLPGVAHVLPLSSPLKHVGRERKPRDTVIRVGPLTIGGGGFTIIAGPCAVETEEQILGVARMLKDHGADLLRGGAFKPRTSPYTFQGLGRRGLELLARAGEETGLPVVSEALDDESLLLVERFADVVQVGARNMQNFSLLRRVGRSRLPVLLKRGMSAGLEELLLAAEYIADAGNPNVILCERGIRTFANHNRYTLDLSIIPAVKRAAHLPILVDPSHGTGRREFVAPMARAALAAGADGVMVEVHPHPQRARCDGPQALQPGEFAALAEQLRMLAGIVSRRTESVS